ncbi:hypothetical protein ANN_14420 [Periplaneta americana]|uniref:Uncharacterized protein n=1 Tax=Periplaneta americana TaxID=6978 RepID=A0ABQ8SW94_PERAM|nr:hypothetical protein ANN_14420 [Periplaneta americana]
MYSYLIDNPQQSLSRGRSRSSRFATETLFSCCSAKSAHNRNKEVAVDVVKPGSGTTNDGNTSRRFFENSKKSSEITGVDEALIHRFSIILDVMSSGYSLNIGAFKNTLPIYEEDELKLRLHSIDRIVDNQTNFNLSANLMRVAMQTKVRHTHTNVKVVVILVYDCDDVILIHTILQRQTVDPQYLCHFLEHNMRRALR